MADISILVLDGAQRSALAVTRSLGCLEWVRVTTAEQGDLISPEPLVLVKKPWNIRALKLNRGIYCVDKTDYC